MSSTHGYDRDGFLAESFPDTEDRAEVQAGAQALLHVSRAHRLAERLGLAQAEVAERMNIRQERVSAIELRTLAAYITALGATSFSIRVHVSFPAAIPTVRVVPFSVRL